MFGSYYNSFDPENLSWTVSEKDPMIVEIRYNGVRAMSFFLGEAMESAGRKEIMKHVRECDKSPWLTKWHDDKMDQEVAILKGNEILE